MDKWIKEAVGKPGTLHKQMGIPKDEPIPTGEIEADIAKLSAEGEGDKKLSDTKRRQLRRLVLAKTLRSFSK